MSLPQTHSNEWMIYVEGGEVFVNTNEVPTEATSFKLPDGSSIEKKSTVHTIKVKGEAGTTVWYMV